MLKSSEVGNIYKFYKRWEKEWFAVALLQKTSIWHILQTWISPGTCHFRHHDAQLAPKCIPMMPSDALVQWCFGLLWVPLKFQVSCPRCWDNSETIEMLPGTEEESGSNSSSSASSLLLICPGNWRNPTPSYLYYLPPKHLIVKPRYWLNLPFLGSHHYIICNSLT